jgi:hypothetical protein
MASRRCWTRKNRKDRKNRKASRKDRRNRRQNGGASPLNESLAGSSASNLNLAQGNQFKGFHTAQHGGEAPFPGGVTDSLLPRDLVSFSRTAPLDKYLADALPVRDPGQMGGRRNRKNRKASRKNRKASRKNRKASRKNRKASRKNRRTMSGGAFSPAPADAPGMLLDGGDASKALRGMNPEWQLAPNPAAFAPK